MQLRGRDASHRISASAVALAKAAMIEDQLRRRGIRCARVLDAMSAIPRERFVSEGTADEAYADRPLPIGFGQTISQPFIVAFMAQAATVGAGDRVLEIGTGSGYAAAVLARLGAKVFTIERHPRLFEQARLRLAELGYRDVEVALGNGALGWPEKAPFDAIIAAAHAVDMPAALPGQLAIGGRLVLPLGPERQQRLVKMTRVDGSKFDTVDLADVSFVPLVTHQDRSASHDP